ncbi:MAG: hypothetical protein WEC33_01070, partial [Dehalococcoidia bacterium]
EYAGRPRCKGSEGKATWPGTKQIYRRFDTAGRMESDVVALARETCAGEPLLVCVMRQGRRLGGSPPLSALRERVKRQLEILPSQLRSLTAATPFPVSLSAPLQQLAGQLGLESGDGGTGPRPDVRSRHHLGLLSHIHADGIPPGDETDGSDDETGPQSVA